MAVQLISHINNFLGLSGDSKPTDTPVGSTFYETDTTDTYVFNGSAWSAVPGTGTSIGSSVSGSTAGSILYVDSSLQLAEDNANLNWDDSGKNLGVGVATPTSKLHLPQENDAVTPTLSFGDGDTGFYELVDDLLVVARAGGIHSSFSTTGFTVSITDGPLLQRVGTTSVIPNINPNKEDTDTGLGSAGTDALSFISGGKEGYRITETTAGNDSLQHTVNGLLGQATGDEVAYSFDYTANKATSGKVTGIKLNLTDTASPGSNILFELQVDASPIFYFTASGSFNWGNNTNGGQLTFGSGRYIIRGWGVNTTAVINDRDYTSADNLVEMATGTLSNTTGQSSAVAILPIYNQPSGDGANTDLLINRTETAVGSGTQNLIEAQIGGTPYFAIRKTSTSGDTYLMLYDVDNGTMERVTVGAADSGGAGYKVLRIPN